MSFAACREKLVEVAEPILVMEMRVLRRSRELVSLIVVSALLLILPIPIIALRDAGVAQVALGVMAAFYVLANLTFIPSHGARAIHRERETGTWDLLALTPVGCRQIVDQKTMAVALPVLLLLVAGAPAVVTASLIGRAPLLLAMAALAMLGLTAMGMAYWSVQASCDCGRAAQWVAYLPLMSFVCGYLSCGGYLAGLVMLFIPQARSQAGRLMLSHLCLQVVSGAMALAVLDSAGVFAPDVHIPAVAAVVVALGLQVLALIGMRHLVIWGIVSWRTAA